MTRQQKFLVFRLLAAVVTAFVASMALNWILHGHVADRERRKLFEKVFYDVGSDIRWRVDVRMIRQAMLARDRYYEMREEPWWNDPDDRRTNSSCFSTARRSLPSPSCRIRCAAR